MSSEPHLYKRRGLMLALVSPSGAGKTTLSRRLVDEDPDIALSVSWTTRAPRPASMLPPSPPSSRAGRYIPREAKMPEYVVPDLTGFKVGCLDRLWPCRRTQRSAQHGTPPVACACMGSKAHGCPPPCHAPACS